MNDCTIPGFPHQKARRWGYGSAEWTLRDTGSIMMLAQLA